MKCIAKSRDHPEGCSNNAAKDGYCYKHHPDAVLTRLIKQLDVYEKRKDALIVRIKAAHNAAYDIGRKKRLAENISP